MMSYEFASPFDEEKFSQDGQAATPSQANALQIALEAIEREIEVIQRVYKRTQSDDELSEYVQPISGKLDQEITDILKKDVDLIRDAINGKGSLRNAWRIYELLKTERLPALTNEALALIGGVYLKRLKLDSMEHLYDGQGLTASDQARLLIEEISDQPLGQQILIVGEERIGVRIGNILRLRYPACDIWNLPFIAHEYGYMIAMTQRPSGDFDTLLSEITVTIDKRKIDSELPPNRYLPEIEQLWSRYRRECQDKESQEEFRNSVEHDIVLLRERQHAQVCRLFADAYATTHIGPAYVYALLHLRFIPGQSIFKPTPNMPPFALRFAFAMKTLDWMNKDTKLPRNTGDPHPFADVIRNLKNLWQWVLGQVGAKDDDYVHLTGVEEQNQPGLYDDWWDAIKSALRKYNTATERMFSAWSQAQQLAKKLDVYEEEIDDLRLLTMTKGTRVAVLNAAWLRRSAGLSDPNILNRIEQNALLILSNPSAFVDPSAAQSQGTDGSFRRSSGLSEEIREREREERAGREQRRKENIKKVLEALRDSEYFENLFHKEIKDHTFHRDSRVYKYLDAMELNVAKKAYEELCNEARQ